MKTPLTGIALAAATLSMLVACQPGTTTSSAAATSNPSTDSSGNSGLGSAPSPSGSTHTNGSVPTSKVSTKTRTPKPSHSSTSTSSDSGTSGPTIVYFEVAQKPKCAEGTAVFRAPAVPLIIKWKITGATSAALSVDDPTNTPGTYGPEGLSGTEEFTFSCAGEVGSTETHKYAIYSVGGGTQKSKSFSVTAKILDKGTAQ